MKLDWSLFKYRFISDFISFTKRQHRFTKCLVVIWVRKNTNILNIEMGTSIKQSFFCARLKSSNAHIYTLCQLPTSFFRISNTREFKGNENFSFSNGNSWKAYLLHQLLKNIILYSIFRCPEVIYNWSMLLASWK